MGETRRAGARELSSTQATSSDPSRARRARSAARCPAASSTRSRRDRSADASASPASRSDRRRWSTRRPTRPVANASRVARSGSLPTAVGAGRTGRGVAFGAPGQRGEAEVESDRLVRRRRRARPATGSAAPAARRPGRRDRRSRAVGQVAVGHPAAGPRPEYPVEDVGEVGHGLDGTRGPVVVTQDGARGDGQGPEPPGTDLEAEAVGHHVLDLVGLVEHHHLVLGQDGATAGEVGAVEVGVDDDDVGLGGPGPGVLGEAVATRRAAEGTRALARRGRHHRPGPEVRLEGQLGPVAGRGVLGPSHQAPHLVGDGGRVRGPDVGGRGQAVVGVGRVGRSGGQRELGARTADLAHPLPADVVAPALEDGEVQVVVGGRGDHAAGPCRRAGPGAPWWPWPPRSARRTGRPGPGRRATCRCPCRPGPRGSGGPPRPTPPPRPSPPARAGTRRPRAVRRPRAAGWW